MTQPTVRANRLAVRMTAGQKATIERAATLLGRSVSDFSVQALTERAEEVLTDRRLFLADPAAWDAFAAALDAPAQDAAGLSRLLSRPALPS